MATQRISTPRVILIILILGLSIQDAVTQDHCWIKYSYDNAGNRIKRHWWCGDPNDPEENIDTSPITQWCLE